MKYENQKIGNKYMIKNLFNGDVVDYAGNKLMITDETTSTGKVALVDLSDGILMWISGSNKVTFLKKSGCRGE